MLEAQNQRRKRQTETGLSKRKRANTVAMIRVQTKKQQLNGHHGHNGHKTPSSAPLPIIALAGLQTEDRNPNSTNIDRVSTQELCRILNREDVQVPKAVEPCIPVIAETIDVLSKRVRNGGRVFYIGAGTSGR